MNSSYYEDLPKNVMNCYADTSVVIYISFKSIELQSIGYK